jgi:UDP-3-O-[3-hydroxymyristoyl] glucosamine N-acyltransferase
MAAENSAIKKPMKVRDVAAALSAEFVGNGDLEAVRLVHPSDAGAVGDLAVALSGEARGALGGSAAIAAVVARPALGPADPIQAVIVVDNARTALADLTELFKHGPATTVGIHPSAIIAGDADIAAGVNIGALTIVGTRSSVGEGTTILSQVTVGADVAIGRDCLIYPGVRIADGVRICDRVTIHYNAAIGSDGFGFIPARMKDGSAGTGGLPRKIHSLGTVIVEDDVEIGAGTTIDRATFDATRIGRGTKIDNLVQIGHNVTIGEACIVCGMVGIAGSARIGDRVLVGGGAGVADHLTIGTEAVITAKAGVGSHVPDGATVSGVPALKHERWVEFLTFLGRHKALQAKLEKLQTRLDALEKSEGQKPAVSTSPSPEVRK